MRTIKPAPGCFSHNNPFRAWCSVLRRIQDTKPILGSKTSERYRCLNLDEDNPVECDVRLDPFRNRSAFKIPKPIQRIKLGI